MALKTFNIDAEIYRRFSEHCKKHGISMSRKIENFIREETMKLKGGNFEINDIKKVLKDKKVTHPMERYC